MVALLAPLAGLDVHKAVLLAIFHDDPEIITGDIVTHGLPPEEKARAKANKRLAEEAAMRTLMAPFDAPGEQYLALWIEYADGSSPEAIFVRELDKVEAAMQSVRYWELGYPSDPEAFITSAEQEVTLPMLRELLTGLRAKLT